MLSDTYGVVREILEVKTGKDEWTPVVYLHEWAPVNTPAKDSTGVIILKSKKNRFVLLREVQNKIDVRTDFVDSSKLVLNLWADGKQVL